MTTRLAPSFAIARYAIVREVASLTTDIYSLETLRRQVLGATREIIRQIGIRQSIVKEIALEKKRQGLPLIDRAAEARLRSDIINKCKHHGVSEGIVLRILNNLIEHAINAQSSVMDERPLSPARMNTIAKKLEMDGQQVIHLEIGEPDFGPPTKVKTTASRSIAGGASHYCHEAGIHSLREALAQHIGTSHAREVESDEVLVTLGARGAIWLSLMSALRPGDEVLLIGPSYPPYGSCIRALGGKPTFIETHAHNEWQLDVDIIEEAMNESTSLLVLNTPSNPTGHVLTRDEMQDIVAVTQERGVSVISDEVYSDFSIVPHTSILEFPGSESDYISSMSKSFGMTGFRIGYVVSSRERIKRMAQLQGMMVTCVPEFIQIAAREALSCIDERLSYKRLMKERVLASYKLLSRSKFNVGEPQSSFYLFPRIDTTIMNGDTFVMKLLERGICVTPGSAYGKRYVDHIRIAMTQPIDTIAQAINIMDEVVG